MDTIVLFADAEGAIQPSGFRQGADGHWHADFSLAESQADAEQVTVILDGRAVVSHCVDLPDFPDAKLVQILPGMMEGLVAGSPNEMHFALAPKKQGLDEEAGRTVFAVERHLMEALLANARVHGVTLSSIIPDYMCLAEPEHNAVLYNRATHTIAGSADGGGLAAEPDLMQMILASGDVGTPISDAQLAAQVTGLATGQEANLLQGDYAPKHNLLAYLSWFRRAGLLAACVLVVWAVSLLMTASENFSRAEHLYGEAERIFKRALPEVTRIVNPEVQMRQKLVEIRQKSGGIFFALSDQLFRAVEASELSALEGVRFDGERGELVVTLSYASFAEGESLKAALQKSGIVVVEGSSRQENNRVYSELTLRRPN